MKIKALIIEINGQDVTVPIDDQTFSTEMLADNSIKAAQAIVNGNFTPYEDLCEVTHEKSLRKNKGEINPCQCKTCNAVRVYPCDKCGVLRSQDEGGTVFTVCDECWDKK